MGAMDVWLLRHAEAHDSSRSGRDEDRELTSKGLSRAEAVARGLASLEPSVDVVLTSPLIRARQTAEAAARALGTEPPRELAALAPGVAPRRTAEELAAEKKWNSVLLVGHQPHLGSLIGLLVFGDARREVPLRKAGVAHVSWEPKGGGRLVAFLPPRILERLAKRK
jgi:phosphohistidine phosphatase